MRVKRLKKNKVESEREMAKDKRNMKETEIEESNSKEKEKENSTDDLKEKEVLIAEKLNLESTGKIEKAKRDNKEVKKVTKEKYILKGSSTKDTNQTKEMKEDNNKQKQSSVMPKVKNSKKSAKTKISVNEYKKGQRKLIKKDKVLKI